MPSWKKVIISGSDAALNSLNVSTSFTASGLIYPTSDNGEESFMQTDGNGNLSFQYVKTVYEEIYNGELTQIVKGTPVYVSGSVGATSKVFRADASIPSKMPVTYITADNIDPDSTGRGILLGLITGVDTTGYSPGTEIYIAPGGGWTSTRPTGSAIVQLLGVITKEGNGGQGVILNPGPNSLPNITSGSVWVGNNDSIPTPIATSSLSVFSAVSASFATTASYVQNAQTASYVLNAVSASYVNGNIFTNNNLATSASFAISASRAISSSFATTASFALSGNGIFSGSFSGSFQGDGSGLTNLPTGSNSVLTQAIPSLTWVFNHNLGTQFPLFTIYNNLNQIIIPESVTADNTNTITITFSSPVAGYAIAGKGGIVNVSTPILQNVTEISTNTTATLSTTHVLTSTCTLTLPSTPQIGSWIKVINLTEETTSILGRNGSLIMGAASDLTLDILNVSFELIYSGNTKGWVIIGAN